MTSTAKRTRSLVITLAIVVATNMAISSSLERGTVPNLPDSPRPKGTVPNLPDSPRPKGTVPNLPDSPRPKGTVPNLPDSPRP